MVPSTAAAAYLEQEYPLARPYSKYAQLYDELGQSEFALAVLPLVEDAIHRHAPHARSVVDLACGTGTAAIYLASHGYRVVGVDRSPQMLRAARVKAAEAGVRVDFQRQNLVQLRLDSTVDVAICLYDSLNYILRTRDLEDVMAAVSGALNPGGILFFDVNTVYCLTYEWGNRVAEEQGSSARLVHLYSYDDRSRIGTLELLCLRNRSDRLERFREIHRERAHTREEIAGALHGAGLLIQEERSFPDLGQPNERSSRLLYIAGKPSLVMQS